MMLTGFLPARTDYEGVGVSWRSDVLAGLTVAVVALPLALAFGITAGVGAQAGIVSSVVAGLVAAVLGGSHVQVSGATGAMAVVLVPIVARYGADAVFTVGLMAGLLLVVAGLLRLGRFVAFIPWPVVEGFTLGIAIVIFLQQVPGALGVAKPSGETAAVIAVRSVGHATANSTPAALALVALVATVMVVGHRVRRTLPLALIAVVLATVVAEILDLRLGQVGSLPSSIAAPSIPSLAPSRLGDLFTAAIAVALLIALQGLLSGKAADGLVDRPSHDPDRELFGQGMANIIGPMFGALPSTGAIARSVVNVRAGARTRVAAIVHSIVLLLIVVFAAPFVARIPLAALAGVLMITAVRTVEARNVRAILSTTRSDAAVLLVTAASAVAFGLIVAVEVGIGAAAVLALRQVANSATVTREAIAVEIDANEEHALLVDHIVAYRLDGALFFAAAQRFLSELADVGDVRVAILRLPDLSVLDATGARALRSIIEDLERHGITVLLKGPSASHVRLLDAVGALERLAHSNHLFTEMDDAVAHARMHVKRADHHDGPRHPPAE